MNIGLIATATGIAEAAPVPQNVPSAWWSLPFVVLLLCIAVLPLLPKVEHWWDRNRNRLLVALALSAITLAYYGLRSTAYVTHAGLAVGPGLSAMTAVLDQAVLRDYVPFIALLFSLYVISGGIRLEGDLRATPANNVIFLAVGTVLASLIGTTGAAMLLIRPLLHTNSERKHVRHTVIFFIFLVCNIGGCLLPLGDPPLLLGYLRGVPFLWTLNLWHFWLPVSAAVLAIYYALDTRMYAKETLVDREIDRFAIIRLSLVGKINFIWLAGVVLSVAILVPGRTFWGWEPPSMFRTVIQLLLAGASIATTPKQIRIANKFHYHSIVEVAALFIGIFITIQVPLEILHLKGPTLGLRTPAEFFWATGTLSSFLDNAPTYLVFFATAGTLHSTAVSVAGVPESLLVAISLGSVFMGAMTYIGNGPNFMVRSIAQSNGIKMPSFFHYMGWSIGILIPIFALMTLIAWGFG